MFSAISYQHISQHSINGSPITEVILQQCAQFRVEVGCLLEDDSRLGLVHCRAGPASHAHHCIYYALEEVDDVMRSSRGLILLIGSRLTAISPDGT